MWPSRWFTPTSGVPWAHASALAAEQPTRSEPTRPGPWVTAMPSRSRRPIPASARARRMMGTITSRWRRDANSGTTPPYGACTSSCEATTLESTLRPPSSTAAAVSSQDVSMPRTITVRPPSPRELRHGHEPHAAGFPARHVLAQEPPRQGMTVSDHDDLAALLRPPRHLVPAHAVACLARHVIHGDLAAPGAEPLRLGLVVGHGEIARQPVHQEEPPSRHHVEHGAHARAILGHARAHVVGHADRAGHAGQVSAHLRLELL